MKHISVIEFQVVKGHPYLRALADLSYHGLTLRGLRLEEREKKELTLGLPGRKIQSRWQIVYEPSNPGTASELLSVMRHCYHSYHGLGNAA